MSILTWLNGKARHGNFIHHFRHAMNNQSPPDLHTKIALIDQQLQAVADNFRERCDRNEGRFDREINATRNELSSSIEKWRAESMSNTDRVRSELSLSIKEFEQRVDKQFDEQQKHIDEKFKEIQTDHADANKTLTESLKTLNTLATETQKETQSALHKIEGAWQAFTLAAKIAVPVIGAIGGLIGWLVQKAGIIH